MTGTNPLSNLVLPCDIDQLAIFLDFDGTLADIVEHPDDVHLPQDTLEALDRLARRTSGALAIVTGRPVQQIDRLVEPLLLPVAGVHGMSRRAFDGTVHTTQHDPSTFAEVQSRLTQLHTQLDDTMIELKPGSVAFHYRRRPDLSETIAEHVHDALGDLEGIDVLHGKMVVEAKTGHADKGSAIRAFMSESPFAGRVALFAGDDVTDEFGFSAVSELGGIAIKIGKGDTRADWRTEEPADFREWLAHLAVAPA
ncbi:trehalose-phosphatase [Aliihoeflea sp. PC F10.4]